MATAPSLAALPNGARSKTNAPSVLGSGVGGAAHQVARLGGDEFAILVEGSTPWALDVAEEVLAAVRLPYDLGVMRLHVDGSIGVADLDQGADPGLTPVAPQSISRNRLVIG